MARGVNVKKLLGELSTVALVSTMARLVSGLSQPKGRRRLGWRCWINWMLLWETQSRGDSLAEEGGHTRHGGRGRCPRFFPDFFFLVHYMCLLQPCDFGFSCQRSLP